MGQSTKTRSARGTGNIRKKTVTRNGQIYTYWEARLTVGIDSGTGKQIRRSFSGKTQKEVREKMQAAAVTVNDSTYQEPSKLTVSDWLDVWLAEYTGDVKPLTRSTYKNKVENAIKPALGAIKLQALKAPQIQKMLNDLQRGTSGRKSLAAKTIKDVYGILHRALEQAVEVGYLRINPSNACKLPRVERAEIKPLDEDQTAAFLNAIRGQPFERLFIVDLLTGLRQGEILGLRWKDVDFDTGTVTVAQQLLKSKEKGGAYFFGSLKNGKTRLLTPAPSVMKALQEQRRVQMEWRLKAGELWEDSGLVFTDELGHHLSHVTVRKHFKKAVESIGIPETRFHDLRHSFAVNSLQAGDSPKIVQENLGHSTASFTLDVYAHATERMKRDSASRMETLFQSAKKTASHL